MNHLDIDHAALTQIRNLYDHRPPPGPTALDAPPRTAAALARLASQWESSRRSSDAARMAHLEDLERFVVAANDIDSELSARLEGFR
ncbi:MULTISPECIES: hypothetical protein [Corynebacterium]|uniref:Uncharacterized protein n=1 Tax=Corynebacterium singulare TaxID=161899 RepID=A0A0B6ETQ1_9CORY|nr:MULTISPECIES: hypothetical protein [Corynebacterium]AJI79892.1 hypothetical protein CSING_11985 [Corynebacterium singulare]OFT58106.1 hypothetical protein HMPREF3149_11105 [Corynebacterium sp. HMSC05E07]